MTNDAESRSYIGPDDEVLELDEQWFKEAKRGPGRPAGSEKERVTIRLDKDVLAHFRGDDPKGWQTRVNAALRKAM